VKCRRKTGGAGAEVADHRPLDAVIERLWRSLKYEAVYLHELIDGFKAERGERF
jgi:hypothetical protein